MKPRLDARGQLEYLTRNAAEVVPREELAAKLDRSTKENRPLRVKLGLDPTAGEVTLGWAVVLRKLREFQDLGHVAVLIVGDFTARVGDPSGKSETRPRLSKEQVKANADRVLGQFDKILSRERLEIRYNSEWLEPLSMEDVLRLTSLYTVARMLERDDFAKRFAAHAPISVMEFLYPLLQAMDSVATKADVELGGTDQKFNLLVGREIQKDYGQEQQVVFTMPLLIGLDGTRVMGQSFGNYVGIAEPPEDIFGKLMSIPDGLIGQYLELCTELDHEQVEGIEKQLAEGTLRPDVAKRRMAGAVVRLYHGAEAAERAERQFDTAHRDRQVPDDVPERTIPPAAVRDGKVWMPRLLVELGLAQSNAEARRLVQQGAVRLDGEPVEDPEREFEPGELAAKVLQVGRRLLAGGVRLAP
jgi:tyrosyl-tRNA synthetase